MLVTILNGSLSSGQASAESKARPLRCAAKTYKTPPPTPMPPTALAPASASPTPYLRPALRLAAALGLALAAAHATAGPSDGAMGLYLQGGHNFKHGTDTDTVFIGGILPFGGSRTFLGSEMTTYVDAFIGELRGPDIANRNRSYTQLGVLAVGRFRFSEGRSPLFAEAGAGGSYLSDIYTKPDGRIQASRANFVLRFGVGASFGERQQHEVTLSYQHFSNAGLKKPNPGEDLLQARYAYRF